MTKNAKNYVIMTSLRRQDLILKSNGYHFWIPLTISYKILFKKFFTYSEKRVKYAKKTLFWVISLYSLVNLP